MSGAAAPARPDGALVSVVAPLRGDPARLEAAVVKLQALLAPRYPYHELVLIDDRPERAFRALEDALLRGTPSVRVVRLSCPVAIETALTAGLETAIGDFVVTADLEADSPEAILHVIEQARGGHDVVVGVTDTTLGHGPLYRLGRAIFYKLASWLMPTPPVPGATILRAMSRTAVNALTRVRQRRRHFGVLLSEIGFPIATWRYERLVAPPRVGLVSALLSGLALLVQSSGRPLRLVAALGILGSALSLGYAVYVLVANLVLARIVEGWTTLSLVMSGLFFLLFVILTMMSEYIQLVLDETSERPLYHVREERVSAAGMTDATGLNVLQHQQQKEPV